MAFTPNRPSGPPGPPRPFPPRSSSNSPGTRPSYNSDEPRVNERIRVPQVRLIDDVGTQVGIVDTREALRMAKDKGLDLMEVSAGSNPPVCKICDYGKFKYEKKKKDHEARKKQVTIKVKEVQFRPTTDDHDLDYKFKNIRTFIEEGDKAKVTIMYRGREMAHTEGGFKLMNSLIDTLKDIAVVESPPKFEGKKMMMILAPAKLAGKKP